MIVYGSIFSLAVGVPGVLAGCLLRRYLAVRCTGDPSVVRSLVRGGIPLMALTIFNLIYGTIDVPILGFITDNVQVGWYSLAYRWVGIPIFVATAVVSAYFPRFSAHGNPHHRGVPAARERRGPHRAAGVGAGGASGWPWSPTTSSRRSTTRSTSRRSS